jgi:hypothetical protein
MGEDDTAAEGQRASADGLDGGVGAESDVEGVRGGGGRVVA